MKRPLIVLKFGSSVLRTEADLPSAVHEIYRWSREGFDVAAVVSAFEGVTDRLLKQARDLGADPEQGVGVSGIASLVASGERESAAALQIALARAGVPASVLDPLSAGLRVEGDGLAGEPTDLDVARCRAVLAKGRVLIVPGFFGVDDEGGVSLLGRGGSDWTALFLAQRLGGRCRLLKDTDGIFEHDPNDAGPAPRRFESLSFDDALALHAPVVQEAALRFAQADRLRFEVAKTGSNGGTSIGDPVTRLAGATPRAASPLRVVLLGLGAVGRGVYEHLRRQPQNFAVVGIAVRDRFRHERTGVPAPLLLSLETALGLHADIVVEAIGGIEAAAEAIRRALHGGAHVVTANKAVIAAHGRELRRTAARQGVRLLDSAAVGGAVPVLEAVRRWRGRIVSVAGVLNGTSNFVLDALSRGRTVDEAVAEAQSLGYAESDPTDDLSGLDAARKLALVAREAFGAHLDAERIPIPGVAALAKAPRRESQRRTRLIGEVRSSGVGCEARVVLKDVELDHPLSRCEGAANRVLITLQDGATVLLDGQGAGRWPTAESVMGDVLEIQRETAMLNARIATDAEPLPLAG